MRMASAGDRYAPGGRDTAIATSPSSARWSIRWAPVRATVSSVSVREGPSLEGEAADEDPKGNAQ